MTNDDVAHAVKTIEQALQDSARLPDVPSVKATVAALGRIVEANAYHALGHSVVTLLMAHLKSASATHRIFLTMDKPTE